MFLSVVLNTEYWDYASRSKGYLKSLLHCKENGDILITHEYLKSHIQEFQKEITPELFSSWEIRPFSIEELGDVEQYTIPDELFDSIELESGSRTQALMNLVADKNEKIERVFDEIILQIQDKHPGEKIEGIFHFLESFQFLRNISQKYNIPLINYSFSAIRKPHGYRQTLYHVNLNGYLYTSKECEERYQRFLKENNDIPVFTNREIITIIGKERTLPLLPLIEATPKFEMGICGDGFALLPQHFDRNVYTDDDVFYECNKYYPKESITVRSHSLHVDRIRLDRSEVRNDPAPFILSCKRLSAVSSQIMLKALLWKRTAVVTKDTLGFSFLCAKNYTSEEVADIRGLNFYVFGYLIPEDLMFSDDYWRWRFTGPSESKIYKRHLSHLFNKLNVPLKILDSSINNRFGLLLSARGVDNQLYDSLVNDKHSNITDFKIATSKFNVKTANREKNYWRLNTTSNGLVKSYLRIKNNGVKSIAFYPFDDVAGCCCLDSVIINGNHTDLKHITKYLHGYQYMPKVQGHFNIPIDVNTKEIEVEVVWKFISIKDFLMRNS